MKLLFISIAILFSCNLHAESKRIEVHPKGLAYWDVHAGDTLSAIINQIFPNRTTRYNQLLAEIVKLNPQAFIDDNPHRLKSNVRLWLPGHGFNSSRQVNKNKYRIKEFSWGYIQTLK